jgi:rare lipoprotein A
VPRPLPGASPPNDPAGPPPPRFTPHWSAPALAPLFRTRPGQRSVPEAAPPLEPELEPEVEAPLSRRAPGPAEPRRPSSGERPGVAARDGHPRDFEVLKPYLEGTASWYGPNFHGKPTSNGEIYNQFGMTAAHPTLPLGTIIRVENLSNSRVVWVRVNDRGPYKKGRILDLSRKAAERLGMVQEGTAPVRISVLRWPTSVQHELGLRPYTQYVVQVGAYPETDKAEHLLEEIRSRFAGLEFMLDYRPTGMLSVVAGPFDDHDTAQQVSRQLQRGGVTSLVRRYRK